MAEVIKIGFTLHASLLTRRIWRVRVNAEKRGYDAVGGRCIWQRPGDTRAEAWMQSTLAFRWRRAYENGNRICEWLLVPGFTEDDLVKILDEVHGLVPADLTLIGRDEA